ncbi:type II toxin-antitoxin system Phd/YefM family antitoxin [Paenibacillus sp. BSR1-1]|uniref:type II toxin-antitoxin system Phd/YefM family antitoxin n=1 Tax=Paenibacillus sp. BSR1-1 TaxID=3020845 RepID=UPI0025B22A2E|nr:type II toxin-antitoxin system Phd/YefM family antitoxin [Paenibacillus sp. BSR1-1]MDN3015797.1 type II toxin-antitoxin system Phd/YefM family antitoxin [Paenibacillus sp. BSR1-1]
MSIDDKILTGVLERMVSVTDLSRGKAPKIITKIVEENENYYIIKNNKPVAVILSLEEYKKLIEKDSAKTVLKEPK